MVEEFGICHKFVSPFADLCSSSNYSIIHNMSSDCFIIWIPFNNCSQRITNKEVNVVEKPFIEDEIKKFSWEINEVIIEKLKNLYTTILRILFLLFF